MANINSQEVKKIKRGVNNNTKAVAQLRFHEKDASQNGLFVGHLEEVRLDTSNNPGSTQFTGLNVTRITLHFASNHISAAEQRHVYYSINPVESTVLTIPNGSEEWKVNNVFAWLKHILDVYYLKGRELNVEEENKLTLPFEDFDKEGNYVSVDPETVLSGYNYIFSNFVDMMNGTDGLPCYKTTDGKFIPCWLKLIRHKKVKGEWRNVAQNGDLGFDALIGNGVVEIIKKDCPPAVLRLDLSKESITPKETKKVPSIGAPNGNYDMGSVAIPSNMPNYGPAVNVGDDMPF